jgi:DNA-binding response OmpR family regulator
MRVVLLADNNPFALETWVEFLVRAGYQVIAASTLSEAVRVLREGRVHLAIIDVRLVNDDDPKDLSGLSLAKNSEFRTIPKIILTGYPTHEIVRIAMSGDTGDVPPVLDFLWKDEGGEALVKAVDKIFSQHVQINDDLVTQFGGRDLVNFSTLASLLDPSLSGEKLLHREASLIDLFRHLFFEKAEIRIERVLWKEAGRAALVVYSFVAGRQMRAQVVVCGLSERVVREAGCFKEFAPEAPGVSGTVLVRTCETQHFAANVYALAGANIENVLTLFESYRNHPDREFKASLEHLFKHTIASWQPKPDVAGQGQSLESRYRKQLGFGKDSVVVNQMRRRTEAVARELPRLRVKLDEDALSLTLHIGRESYTYPHPASCLYCDFAVDRSQLVANSPGDLTGENILADQDGRTWLTDFAQAGPKPLLWNHAALENVVRFDWVESEEIAELHQMELALIDLGFDGRDTADDLHPRLRKPVRAIREIRQLASRAGGPACWREYQVGLFYHAARRMMSFDPSQHLTNMQLAKIAHVVMTQAMICQNLSPEYPPPLPPPTGLYLDRDNYTVIVEGRRIHLPPQSFGLLEYLYERKGQICRRKEIIERMFEKSDYKYDESLERCLNTCMTRLRKKIEPNPAKPRYIIKEQGVGYRLMA